MYKSRKFLQPLNVWAFKRLTSRLEKILLTPYRPTDHCAGRVLYSNLICNFLTAVTLRKLETLKSCHILLTSMSNDIVLAKCEVLRAQLHQIRVLLTHLSHPPLPYRHRIQWSICAWICLFQSSIVSTLVNDEGTFPFSTLNVGWD